MNFTKALEKATNVIAALKLGGADPKLGKLDFGILVVALMVAALDGTILPSEVEAFQKLAKLCRGHSEANAKAAFDEAMRKAGHVLAMAQTRVCSEDEIVRAFVAEAEMAMPRGFVDGELADVRRAFATWTAMGISDGDFSGVERKAIAALKERFADVKDIHQMSDAAALTAACVGFRPAGAMLVTDKDILKVQLLADDFLDKAEALTLKLDDPEAGEAAAKELDALIRG